MILQGQCCVNYMFYFQTSNAHQLTRSLDLILLNLKDLIGRPVIWNVLDVSNVAPSGESISRTSPSSQNTRRVDFFWKADQQRTFIKLLKQIYHLTHILLDIEAKGRFCKACLYSTFIAKKNHMNWPLILQCQQFTWNRWQEHSLKESKNWKKYINNLQKMTETTGSVWLLRGSQ